MKNKLKNLTLSFFELAGDELMTYEINDKLTAAIPNVGEIICIDGSFWEVVKRDFMYLSNLETINVTLHVKLP